MSVLFVEPFDVAAATWPVAWYATGGLSSDGVEGIIDDAGEFGPEAVRPMALSVSDAGDFLIETTIRATGEGYVYYQLRTTDFDHNAAVILSWGHASWPNAITLYDYSLGGGDAAGTETAQDTVYDVEWQIERSTNTMRARYWPHGTIKPALWAVECALDAAFVFEELAVGGLGTSFEARINVIQISDAFVSPSRMWMYEAFA